MHALIKDVKHVWRDRRIDVHVCNEHVCLRRPFAAQSHGDVSDDNVDGVSGLVPAKYRQLGLV